MLFLSSSVCLVELFLLGCGAASPVAVRQTQQPNLLTALQNAAKVSCGDHTFTDSDEIDPVDDSSFKCDDDSANNACTGYGPADNKCDQSFGPAQNMILNSLSWVNNYYAPMQNALTAAEVKGLADVGNIAKDFVAYNKPQMSAADILGAIAEILMPVGAGQFIANGIRKAVVPLAADAMKVAEKASATSQYYLGKMNDYKVLANQMGFEFSAQAEAVLAGGKNPTDGAAALIEETADFEDLIGKIGDNWSSTAANALNHIFSGTTATDLITNGISNYASLTAMVSDGKYSRSMTLGDIAGTAATAMFSQLLPLAIHQNDNVRPTLIIRPYACGDKTRSGADTTFNSMFMDPSNKAYGPSSVTLPEHPNLCFFLVDANKNGAGLCLSRAGCGDKPRPLVPLPGFVSTTLNGQDFGGMTLANYTESLYNGWVANKKANGVPTYKVDPNAAGGNVGNLFDNPFSSAGLFNSFFNVCGNDDPTSALTSRKTPDDIELIEKNIEKAQDWSKADSSKGYPCRTDI
ncbi:hypothetical protein G7Y89_g11715 [Cudoniella acicularis]|uniref:Uncharacterized protein n=1 Tax=Cudoniella acicularis TaxID=354080 RepID=A0A8H4VXR7_9HELO|nr:hypothetical protein G7Y89_g11715 [Cudoniella acicularis]